MCTYYTLHYKCGHTQTSHRCPRLGYTHTDQNGGTAFYPMECGDKYYLNGGLNDDCMPCKVKRGLVPGQQTGLDTWAKEVNVGIGSGRSVRAGGIEMGIGSGSGIRTYAESGSGSGREHVYGGRERAGGVDTVNPTLLVSGGGISDGQGEQDDLEARLRAAWAHEQRARSSSTAASGSKTRTIGRGAAWSTSAAKLFSDQSQ